MTLMAAVPTFRDGVPGGETVDVTSDEDVARLVELLAQPWTDTISRHRRGSGFALRAVGDGVSCWERASS